MPPAAAQNGIMNISGDMIDPALTPPDIKDIPEEIHKAEMKRHLLHLAGDAQTRIFLQVPADRRKDLFNAKKTRDFLPGKIFDLHRREDNYLLRPPAPACPLGHGHGWCVERRTS